MRTTAILAVALMTLVLVPVVGAAGQQFYHWDAGDHARLRAELRQERRDIQRARAEVRRERLRVRHDLHWHTHSLSQAFHDDSREVHEAIHDAMREVRQELRDAFRGR